MRNIDRVDLSQVTASYRIPRNDSTIEIVPDEIIAASRNDCVLPPYANCIL
jgi:hypothetical protein